MSDCKKLTAETDWSALAYPRQCGLLAQNPSRLGQAMHNAAFTAAGLPFFYTAFPTRRTEVGIEAMRELGFRGLSLTIPHKERAMSLVDAISPEVQAIGALNTVVNTGKVLIGFNTDCYGIQKALEEAAWEASSSRVLLIGAGGAARAALYSLQKIGCPSVVIANRNPKRAENLTAQFTTSNLGASSLRVETLAWEQLRQLPGSEFDLLLNASAVGMPTGSTIETESIEFPYPLANLTSAHTVFDMVTAETDLIVAAEAVGARCVRGIRMLLHQAVEQNRLFTEQEPSVESMEQALLANYPAA